MFIEHYQQPFHLGQEALLSQIARTISVYTLAHEFSGDWYHVSHLGVIDSLGSILPDLLRTYSLNGVHLSCQSGKHEIINKPGRTYTIWCLVFTEKQSDFIHYHLSFLCEDPLTIDQLIAKLDPFLQTSQNSAGTWSKKTPTSASYQFDG